MALLDAPTPHADNAVNRGPSADALTPPVVAGGYQMLGFKDEMAQTPPMLRWTIYISLFCLVMLAVQCVVVMPLILGKYGWGYSVN